MRPLLPLCHRREEQKGKQRDQPETKTFELAFDWSSRSGYSLVASVEDESESAPDQHRACRSIQCPRHARAPQPCGERPRRQREQRKPENALGGVNRRQKHAEPSHPHAGGDELRQNVT